MTKAVPFTLELQTILQQYSCMIPRIRFAWPSITFDEAVQEQICSHVLRHPLLAQCPPSKEYRKSFMEQLIQKIESSGQTPIDSLLERMAEILIEPPEPEYCFKTYWVSNDTPITVFESRAIISKGTTGLTTWDSGKLFVEYIAENHREFDGKSVLELGCGAGLVASAILRLCQVQRLAITDIDPEVLRLAEKNVLLNEQRHQDLAEINRGGMLLGAATMGQLFLSLSRIMAPRPHLISAEEMPFSVNILDWCTVSDAQLASYDADVVVATDCAYDVTMVDRLSTVFGRLLGMKPTAYALVSVAIRNKATIDTFLGALDRHGLLVEDLPLPKPRLHYDRGFAPIQLMRIHASC